MKLVHVTTVPASFVFLEDQVATMRRWGWEVEMISSSGPAGDAFARRTGVPVHRVEMERAITPLRDLDALARLTDLLLDIDPAVVHAHTPKGGLLGMLAARAAMAPVCVYQMRGLVTLTASGLRKRLLSEAERTSCRLADRVVCQSRSLQQIAVDERLAPADKLRVLASGSNGVDTDRFDPQRWRAEGKAIREQLGIGRDDVVIGFVGRLVGDKGVVELARAWESLRESYRELHLVMVGPFEERDPVPADVRRTLEGDDRVHLVGFQARTEPFYAAMDVVTLPSYREGFPNVPLEAAAMGLPVVSTLVTGCVDAVADGRTGLLVPPAQARALAHALTEYIDDPTLRRAHGEAGRARVERSFRPEEVHRAVHRLYNELLLEKDLEPNDTRVEDVR